MTISDMIWTCINRNEWHDAATLLMGYSNRPGAIVLYGRFEERLTRDQRRKLLQQVSRTAEKYGLRVIVEH